MQEITKGLFLFLILFTTLFISSNSFALKTGEWRWMCSGFFINDHGYIATAAHCIPKSLKIYVEYQGEVYKATFIDIDVAHDTAIIKIDISGNDYLSIGDKLNIGDTVYTLGYPIPATRGYGLKITQGEIEDIRMTNYIVDGGSCQGNSGGPVVDEYNGVIGMLVAGWGQPCSGHSIANKIVWTVRLALRNGVEVFENTNTEVLTKDQILGSNQTVVTIIFGR